MVIDVVHDTQEVFRTFLHCMSRPGTIKNIDDIGNQMEQLGNCRHATFLGAMTLLDAEVRFHIIGENAAEIEEVLSAYTLSKATDLHKADYIFILQDVQPQMIGEVFNQAKKGTLTNPQQSATIIIEMEKLSNDPQLTLHGPGIKTKENVQITASELWVSGRAKANKEYPLGVDMILIDHQSNIMCLPRTTIIDNCEVS
ncbi:phosphonate C-P lyase system protein PhnH [Cytobacillus depressus]|uniref:Phosphonate C-P lyase system protein PhnH n=1 Tax=Cytobacillus depressus TaxID=1602942 RepID=A0A6L3UYV2_9BACI|nr:phosphonate C-P lyase system protein PhnH [Cytobacillus depressus]KAB2329388.1 phosphonate C-P lyase system protein PhnH [Cytobacillus depressus]